MIIAFSVAEARAAIGTTPAPLALAMPVASAESLSVPLAVDEEAAFAAIAHGGQRRERRARRMLLRALLGLVTGDALTPLARGAAGEMGCEHHFLSSSSRNGIVAAAIGPTPLGIDVEDAVIEPPWALLHPAEAVHIHQGCAAGALWCAKEAVWKARRMPLSRDPASFCVRPDDDGRFVSEDTRGAVAFMRPLSCYFAWAITTS